MNRIRHALGSGATIPVILLLAWAGAVHFGFLDARLWSSPELVAAGGWTALRDGTLLAALSASLKRDAAGFAIGAGAGLILGLVLARVRLADRLLSPTLNATRQIALFAWVPFLSLWLGNGEVGRIAFIALASFFPVLINTHLGAAQVEAGYLDVARVLCLKPHRLLLKVILPSAFPSILTGCGWGYYAWLATIGAEYLLPPRGVGDDDGCARPIPRIWSSGHGGDRRDRFWIECPAQPHRPSAVVARGGGGGMSSHAQSASLRLVSSAPDQPHPTAQRVIELLGEGKPPGDLGIAALRRHYNLSRRQFLSELEPVESVFHILPAERGVPRLTIIRPRGYRPGERLPALSICMARWSFEAWPPTSFCRQRPTCNMIVICGIPPGA